MYNDKVDIRKSVIGIRRVSLSDEGVELEAIYLTLIVAGSELHYWMAARVPEYLLDLQ
jgi:hypothetical protein